MNVSVIAAGAVLAFMNGLRGANMDTFKPKKVIVYNYSDECKEAVEIDFTGYGSNGGRKGNKSDSVSKADREHNYKRIKRNTRRLCLANDLGQIHLVLTYKENMQDVDKADKHFKKFIFKLRQLYPYVLYLATREFQKRGAIHYHVLLNQRVDIHKVQAIWVHGFITLVAHKNQFKSIMYVLKYISKEVGETVLKTADGHTKKSYLCSQGLKKELEACTSKFVINSSEGYTEYNDGLNFIMTNLPVVWDLPISIDINTFDESRTLEGRTVLVCANKAV